MLSNRRASYRLLTTILAERSGITPVRLFTAIAGWIALGATVMVLVTGAPVFVIPAVALVGAAAYVVYTYVSVAKVVDRRVDAGRAKAEAHEDLGAAYLGLAAALREKCSVTTDPEQRAEITAAVEHFELAAEIAVIEAGETSAEVESFAAGKS